MSLSSLWNDVTTGVSKFFTKLKARVVDLLSASASSVAKAIADNADKIEGDAVTFFERTAADAVSKAAATPGTPEAKAAVALSTFLADLPSGVVIATNDAKILLENAYANFKATQAQAA